MKINDILDQELKNSEFAKEFYADKEKSANAIALYKAREEARLTQANSAERTGVSTIYYCTN
ncbi:hypothetical protein [uncultured Lactobacillus sp.]|jgi:hypothetical protein|uniref:hypothetical protein n=1 Tax=uncultured Lactobacillus sp. TaxID=153152 RepID=UPI002804B60A|nr:hypothetical protein [uncultured Lactobacillus sp.]